MNSLFDALTSSTPSRAADAVEALRLAHRAVRYERLAPGHVDEAHMWDQADDASREAATLLSYCL